MDLSHVSAKTMNDVLDISQAPGMYQVIFCEELWQYYLIYSDPLTSKDYLVHGNRIMVNLLIIIYITTYNLNIT